MGHKDALNNFFEELTDLYRIDNINEPAETASISSDSSFPLTRRKEEADPDQKLFVTEFINTVKNVLIKGDIEKSFKDCTRIDLKINNYPFNKPLKNQLQSIANQNHITQQAINYLTQFYLNNGFSFLNIANYLLTRMNQDGFFCLFKAFSSCLLDKTGILFNLENFHIALNGNNKEQYITVVHLCVEVNQNTGMKEACFTLVITIHITWENQFPQLTLLKNEFYLTEYGNNLRVGLGERSNIPFQQVLNHLFSEVYHFRKEFLDEINSNTQFYFINKPLAEVSLGSLPPSKPYLPPMPADMMGGYY